MRKILLSGFFVFAAMTQAQACPGSVAAGLTLTAPTTIYQRNATTCALLSGGTVSIAPSTIASAQGVFGQPGAWTFTPLATGSGTVTFAAPGAAPLNVPLTTSLFTQDATSQ